ncbi:MAG TPA: hypothetical protein ENN66_11805 [Proteobacteria bacterium]|nr:hypothetical protein [Pseudomonadota bacterium]
MNGFIHIIGCGKFGRRALAYYSARKEVPPLVLVDAAADELAAAVEMSVLGAKTPQICREDAVVYLARLLLDDQACAQDWIIPTAPLHLAFAVLEKISGRRRLAWENLPDLPNLFSGPRDEVYSSLADFLCPDHCPQPRRTCFVTGKKRDPSLLRRLARLKYQSRSRILPSLILPSTQLGPGLGGFPLRRLRHLTDAIERKFPGPLLFSTACRCHGVTNILGPGA